MDDFSSFDKAEMRFNMECPYCPHVRYKYGSKNNFQNFYKYIFPKLSQFSFKCFF